MNSLQQAVELLKRSEEALRGALPIIEDSAAKAAERVRRLPIDNPSHDKWVGVALTMGRQAKEIRELLGLPEI